VETIYMAIAAHDEPYLELMLDNCLENSKYPERIHFGIWCHNNKTDRPNLNKYKNINYIFADCKDRLGLGISRLNSFSFYNGEDYFLQVDAHTLFEKNWDTKIISKFKTIKEKYTKPIISSYLPYWYTKNGEIQNYKNDIRAPWSPMRIDTEYGLVEGYPKLTKEYFNWNGKEYYEHFLITGHFIFSDPSIMTEVAPDPKIVFDGDEITTALRLWTRGYQIFTIDESIAWHLNKAEDEYYINKEYPFDKSSKEYLLYENKARLGRERTRDILTGKILGYWGSPSLEKLKEFEELVGVNFKEFYKEYSGAEIHIGIV
jgi:hypothetical protein